VAERKQVLLRMDPVVHDALVQWAADEFRSLNAHIEMLLRRMLDDAGRLPKKVGPLPRRGRPPAAASDVQLAGQPPAGRLAWKKDGTEL
jgi:hypothetical protein